jgi:hypothetical protein
MSRPEENARQDDPAGGGSPEPEPEGDVEERPAPGQNPAESSELEGAPRGDPTP